MSFQRVFDDFRLFNSVAASKVHDSKTAPRFIKYNMLRSVSER